MQSPNIQTPPTISITLALNQDVLQEDEALELCATAVSHALSPITIRTRDSFLDLRLVQQMNRSSTNFQCVDLDADTPPVQLSRRKCAPRFRRLRHKLDHSDSEYFHTLQPEVPYKFSSPCSIAYRELVPGHRYRLSFKKEQEMKWWREGTKEEVLAAPGQELPHHMLEASGAPIKLMGIEPFDFSAPPDWKNIGASLGWDASAITETLSRGTSVPPSVTATISLNTSNLLEAPPEGLSIVVVSHALTPVTVWILNTILNLEFTQSLGQCGELTLVHLDTDTSIPMNTMFRTKQDHIATREDRYFSTLQPEQPYNFSDHFTPSFIEELERRPGRYRFALSGREELKWWKEGLREDIVPPFGEKLAEDMYESSGEPIVLTGIEPIEFTIPFTRYNFRTLSCPRWRRSVLHTALFIQHFWSCATADQQSCSVAG
jgi:hypothetical protein